MKNTIIRNVSHRDLIDLLNLMTQLKCEISKQDLLQNIELFIHSDKKSIWIAEKDQKAVGCIAIQLINTFHRKEKLLKIVTLVVDKAQRRKKIATSLIEKAESFAIENNCFAIELTSSNYRKKEGAHEFYKKMGYKKNGSKIYFRKDI